MTLTTEPNRAVGALHTRCPFCGGASGPRHIVAPGGRPECVDMPEPEAARDPPPAGTRGENSRLGPDAGNPSTQSSPETSGVPEKKLGAEIAGLTSPFEAARLMAVYGRHLQEQGAAKKNWPVKYSAVAIGRARNDALDWLRGDPDGYPRSWEQEARHNERRGYLVFDEFEAPPIAGYEALERDGLVVRGETVIRKDGEERVHFRSSGKILSNGADDFQRAFRDVWLMPYVALPHNLGA